MCDRYSLVQVRCTASDPFVTMLIRHSAMYIGAYYCKIACNSVSNLVMRVSLVVLMSFPQICIVCCEAYLGCDVGASLVMLV